jgi:hypothetical protein
VEFWKLLVNYFTDMKVFLYPMIGENGEIINSDNLKVHPRMKELYKFFKFNGKVVDINDDPSILEVFSREVLNMINHGKVGNHASVWNCRNYKEHQLLVTTNKVLKEIN